MRISDILLESEQAQLDEINVGNAIRGIGRGIGSVVGGTAQGLGAVAGGIAGTGRAFSKGFDTGRSAVSGDNQSSGNPGSGGSAGPNPAPNGPPPMPNPNPPPTPRGSRSAIFNATLRSALALNSADRKKLLDQLNTSLQTGAPAPTPPGPPAPRPRPPRRTP